MADVEVEEVQTRRRALDSGKELAPGLEDPQDAALDVDLAVSLVELTESNDAGRQPGYVVHPGQRAVLPIAAGEDDHAAALDLHLGAVSKVDGPPDAGIELGEDALGAGHVVRRTGVQDPPLGILFTAWPKLGEDFSFLEVDAVLLGW